MVARCLALQSSGEPETLRTIATTFVVRIEEELECWSAGAGAGAGVLELQTRDARREAPSMAVASGGGGVQHHVVACMRHQPDKAGAKDAGSSSRQVASETAGVPGACSATRASMCSRRLQTL